MPDKNQTPMAYDPALFERKKHRNPLRRLRAWLYWRFDR